jgi:hypothetical protein
MGLIENLEFNGSSDILQYIPTVPDVEQEEPKPQEPPMFQARNDETPELFKSQQIQMDFSTPIADVVPSAEFESMAPLGGPYKNPQNNKVVSLSLDNTSAGPAPKTANPFGLNDEQFHAAVAGIAAVVAFSKPVQNKLGEMIPQFTLASGDLSVSGLAVTAFIAALAFFVLMKVLKPPPKK